MKPSKDHFFEFIKAMAFSVKQFRLYAETHPVTKQALETLELKLNEYFKNHEKLVLGSLQGRLVIDGSLASDRDSTGRELAKELDRLGVEGIIFSRGLEIGELTTFIKMMATRIKTIEEQGGFRKFVESAKLSHIQLSTGKFQLLEDGQSVSEETLQPEKAQDHEVLKTSSGSRGIAQIIQRLREESFKPEEGESFSAEAAEGMVLSIEKKPREIAAIAIEQDADPEHLESLIQRIVKTFTKGLVGFLIAQGKDISKALERLSKEFEKALKSLGQGNEYEALRKKIPQMFERGADDLRVEMITRTYQEAPEDKKGIEKITRKLLKDGQVRQRLEAPLKSGLMGLGMPGAQVDSLLEQTEIYVKKGKKTISVDREEYEDMKRKVDVFDQELRRQVGEATEKIEQEKKRILSEKERVEAVVRNLSEGVLVVDKSGKVVMMNPAAERLLGVQAKEKMGKAVSEGLREEHVLAMTQGDLADSGEEISKNIEMISLNDETKRILQASTAIVENEKGQTVGMVSVLSDVTKQKELDALKSQFVANVSHELRTPLVAIKKSIATLLANELGQVAPEQQDFLNIAHRNIDRLSRLINDLLDISKLEANKMTLSIQEISMFALLKQLQATFDTWMRDKQIEWKISKLDVDLLFEADSDRLMQVLTNLVGNAIKFTPQKGKVEVKVDCLKEGAMDFVRMYVCDSGIGISPEDQKKIFNKFEQVSLVQPAGVSSTGLGLTIAKEIVELHGGKIWVESEVNKGSCFGFMIPLKQPAKASSPQ